MGSGTLTDGKFNLILSVRHNADAARLAQWRASFERASELLYDATDGQHQFGDVHYCNDSSGGHYADAWLHQEAPVDVESSSPNDQFGLSGNHQTLYEDERYKPFILIHEFGHYAYDLWDEYLFANQAPGASCTDDPDSGACIMEFNWRDGDRFGVNAEGGALVEGPVSEFCVSNNHTQGTLQGPLSCWETIAADYGLALPANLPEPAAPVATPINWIELIAQQRFMLVIDRSGSMSGNKLVEAKHGADWWAAHSVVEDRLGIVFYSHEVDVVYALQEIQDDSDREAAQDAIYPDPPIEASGATSIGDGLRTALDEILGLGPRAATQIAVLLTDGIQNTGEHPLSVLPDLIDNGVRLYVIGVGTYVDEILLLQLATDTGGTFYRIDPALPQHEQEFAIRTALQVISGEVRDNGGVVTIRPGSTNPGTQEDEVYIEPGSQMATFALSWQNHRHQLELELQSPEGEPIALNSVPKDVRPISNGRPYMGYQIMQPAAGTWRFSVRPERVEGVAEYRVLVFSENPLIDGGLTSRRRFYRPGDTIPLHLQVYHGGPVTGLNIKGTAVLPGGARVDVMFSDDGDEGMGDRLAGDAAYNSRFSATDKPGVYTFEVEVESDGQSARHPKAWVPLGEERPVEPVEHEPIPRFYRRFTLSVAVGREEFAEARLEPNSGRPGQRLHVMIEGRHTHFSEHDTQVDLGEGIDVGQISVVDDQTALVWIHISEYAEPGWRDVTVETAYHQEKVEVEAGFRVTEQTDADIPAL